MRRPGIVLSSITLALALLASSAPSLARTALPASGPIRILDSDPLLDPHVLIDGDIVDRVTWDPEVAPAFPGDAPGALVARYLSTASTARLAWPLSAPLDQDDAFTAAAVIVLRSEGFVADPNGFAQISWALWNSRTTGVQRTVFAADADSFELLEFDYFPNVSPFFGGPYLSPSIFGVEDRANPSFPFAGAYANANFAFGPPVALPLDTPLLATVEHRPEDRVAIWTVSTFGPSGAPIPVPGAVAVIALDALSRRAYAFDVMGLTLYLDPFSGPTPSVDVTVELHAIGARAGSVVPSHSSIKATR